MVCSEVREAIVAPLALMPPPLSADRRERGRGGYSEPESEGKNPAAVALGRMSGEARAPDEGIVSPSRYARYQGWVPRRRMAPPMSRKTDSRATIAGERVRGQWLAKQVGSRGSARDAG